MLNVANLNEYIPSKPAGQRVWVVRASSGQYVEHFLKYSLMAIGHVDQLGLSEGALKEGIWADLETRLQKADLERSKGSVTSHANQVRNFCYDIQENDLVVTLDSRSLMVGRVAGEAYVDKNAVSIEHSSKHKSELNFLLRRPVQWGPKMKRSDVPYALEMTLLAHQTVFNLDGYWQAIYHLIYPIFASEDTLYFSTLIEQQEELNNFSIAQMFGILSGIEAAAKALATDPEGFHGNYSSILETYSGQLTLSSQAEFMSPGSIWSKVKVTSQGMAYAALIYAMLFGAKTPIIETDGIFDLETRRKVLALVQEIAERHFLDKIKNDLEIKTPSFNTEAIEKNKPAPNRPRIII